MCAKAGLKRYGNMKYLKEYRDKPIFDKYLAEAFASYLVKYQGVSQDLNLPVSVTSLNGRTWS